MRRSTKVEPDDHRKRVSGGNDNPGGYRRVSSPHDQTGHGRFSGQYERPGPGGYHAAQDKRRTHPNIEKDVQHHNGRNSQQHDNSQVPWPAEKHHDNQKHHAHERKKSKGERRHTKTDTKRKSEKPTTTGHRKSTGKKELPSTGKAKGSDDDDDEDDDDDDSETELKPYPPPYWEEKVARSHKFIMNLEKNPEMKRALIDNPLLAEEFMKHPHIAKEVARNPELAKLVIASPPLIVDLAATWHELKEHPKRYSRFIGSKDKAQNKDKLRKQSYAYNRTGILNQLQENHHGSNEKLGEETDIPGREESMDSLISRATMPKVIAPAGEPESVKYLIDSARLFMIHHVEIEDGFSTCCDVERDFFDIMNVYGRLMYRVYETKPSRRYCGIFRPFEMAVKEPDGTDVIVMLKRFDFFRNMRKVAVYCPPGTYVGSVEEKWGFCTPKMVLRNKEGDAMIEIRVMKRPFMSRFKYHPNFEFELRTIGAHNAIGKIGAEWLDLPPGVFPNEKIYGIRFPHELSCDVKIIVMTAWFLTYNLYFHGKLKKNIRHNVGDSERALLEFAAGGPNKTIMYDPSSDSNLTISVASIIDKNMNKMKLK